MHEGNHVELYTNTRLNDNPMIISWSICGSTVYSNEYVGDYTV